jgi:aryl-alcohol dehydrogenase-like predicted oxidoreductase
MIYRELGTTGERVSAIGLGGYHIGKQPNAEDSYKLIHSAIDRGITFMDNCWDYNDGLSEVRMGHAQEWISPEGLSDVEDGWPLRGRVQQAVGAITRPPWHGRH